MALDCPRCGLPLREETYEGVPVDACPECWGYWLDKGEFAAIADSKKFVFSDEERRKLIAWANVEHARRAREKAGEKAAEDPAIPCPKCGKTMAKLEMNVEVPITLDRCKQHGIWFDTRELKLAQVLAEKAGWVREFFLAKLKE
jgi:Zn-finger nucleic acid-binding protein